MAFKKMLDFKKLMDQSPEAVAERKAAVERMQADLDAAVQRQIDERRAIVDALESIIAEDSRPGMNTPPRVSEWEVSFVRSMSYRATSYCALGKFGGKLADLSDRQMATLDGLARRLVPHLLAARSETADQEEQGADGVRATAAPVPRG